MLLSCQIADTPATQRLVKLWSNRYMPNLSSSPRAQDPDFFGELLKASSEEGRVITAQKLHEELIRLNCEFAMIQARALHEYIPTVMNLQEARQVSQFSIAVYLELVKLYQERALISSSTFSKWEAMVHDLPLSTWGIPDIAELAQAIEPLLLEYQEQYLSSSDWCLLGFMTTHFNFSGKVLLQKLTPVEQLLIGPYFKFVEEQVALPWQRVCAAAAHHSLDSPILEVVEQLMPQAESIAETVYRQLLQDFPEHRSRRGGLDNPAVKHSCLCDLNMFQAYLWLCVLEDSLAPVEKELLMLCVMVMTRVGVPWEMTLRWNRYLMNEVLQRTSDSQRQIVLPYTQNIEQAFYRVRSRFGATD
ncbi:MAG: hypothetical protein IGS38_04560 [Synechococcales cyanobacterium M58_A2018_015]|nr:hypothetical protein [Synechococcales cyanobacterium M58_A2018_015]